MVDAGGGQTDEPDTSGSLNYGAKRAEEPEPSPLAEEPDRIPNSDECRRAFDRLVDLTLRKNQQAWSRLNRPWTDDARRQVETTIRATEAASVAGCVRRSTTHAIACQFRAPTAGAWRQCESGAAKRRKALAPISPR